MLIVKYNYNNIFFQMIPKQYLSNIRDRKQMEKQQTLKLIRNKLSPMGQDKKLSMGMKNFVEFKNLQKVPKLKKKHFTQISTKSNIEQALNNSILSLDQKENQDHIVQKIYQSPNKWLKIWKKTGDQLQNQYFVNKLNDTGKNLLSKCIFESSDLRLKGKKRLSIVPDFSKTTRDILKKVEIFKKIKNQQIEESQKFQLLRKSKRTTKNITENEANQQQNNQQENNAIKKNQEWVTFITEFIVKKNLQSSQEDKIFAEYKARKSQNRIKQFINLFERQNKTSRTCHLQNLTLPQNRIHDDFARENICQDKSRVIECNNPVFKLRRLQSLCKIMNKSNECNVIERLQPGCGFTSQKLRINSNHKKIIKTHR